MKIQKTFRILAAILAIALLSTFTSAVFAENDVTLIAEAPAVEKPMFLATSVLFKGNVAEVNAEEEVPYILVDSAEAEGVQIHLHISEETALIKADGTPIALTDLSEDSLVVVYHSAMTTRSLPPQSTAFAVILLEKEDDFYPIYTVAGDKNEEGGIATLDDTYVVYAMEDCEVIPYKTRNIVTLDDITSGTKILVWSKTMTMSIPAQLNAEKIMILAEAVSGTPAASENLPSDWAKEEVAAAEELGLLKGFENISYQKNITRAEFAKLIVNCITPVLGLPAEEILGDNKAQFTDIDDLSVNVAALLGIVNGVGDDLFAPEKEITRQEIAVMIHRAINTASVLLDKTYIEATLGDLNAYTDAASVADWAKTAVGVLAANDIMKGTGENTLSPLSQTTTEQAILLVARIFNIMKK